MIVRFDKSFLKSLHKINDNIALKRIEQTILKAEKVNSLNQLRGVKKLNGFSNLFRIKIGDYRIGFELINSNEILLIMVLHRKDIYKKFP